MIQPDCGMWLIQGTVTKDTDNGTISPQFATFYLHPEVQGCSTPESAENCARTILNPHNDPKITPNVSAHLVSVSAINDWTEEDREKMDPKIVGQPLHTVALHRFGSLPPG